MIHNEIICTHLVISILAALCFAAPELPQVDGTTGAPLGGFGTGAVKFCGNSGKVYFTDVAPAKCGDYAALSANFSFFSNRGGTITTSAKLVAVSSGGLYDDDAIFPIQKANFGAIDGVSVRLIGSCPWEVLDSNKLNWPCVMYEFSVTNNQASSVDAAVGFKLTTGNNPTLVLNKGFKDETNLHQKAIYAKSSDAAAVITTGSDANFLTSGQCSNAISGTTNMVAVKVSLAANETKYLKFVFAWYSTVDISMYYYTNLFTGVGGVADSGLANFDVFKTNAETFVTRMRSSNVPDWVVNTTLNSLCNLTNNSRYFKDKRTFFAEGYFGTQGTMDQMWHARQIFSQLCPYFAWKELEFWARTQKTDSAVGQIHHDVTGGCNVAVATWDQTTWVDYRDVNNWPDLNCGFIVGVYETFIATGDRAKLDFFWPYVLKAGQRVLTQLKQYGDKAYPYTFDNTAASSYDWNGAIATHLYNSSLSIATYKILSKLASIRNDAASKAKFDAAHDTAVVNFKKRFIDAIFPTGHYCEAISAGASLTDFLKLGHDFSSGDIDKILNQLNTFYNPLTDGCGKNEGPDFGGNYYIWQMYLLTNYGDLSLIAGKKDVWYAMRHDNYERTYQDRDRVFNISLPAYLLPTPQVSVATDPNGDQTYITNPALFRDYYTIIGYQRDKNSGELWLEPNLPASMNDTLKNGFYISPEGDGTVSFTQDPANFEQRITFKPDNTVQVNQIYVKDKYGATIPPVWVNKIRVAVANISRIGIGYGKELKINWTGAVTSSGLAVEIAQSVSTFVKNRAQGPGTIGVIRISGKRVLVPYSLDNAGPVSIALFCLDGRKVKGAIISQEAGTHEFVLDRSSAGFGKLSGSTYLLEINTGEDKKMYKISFPF